MIGGEGKWRITRNDWARSLWKVSTLWFGSIALFEQRFSTRAGAAFRDCREKPS